MPHEVLQGPWEKIGADFFEFEFTSYLLIANYYSKVSIIRGMRSTMTNATIDVMKQVFSENSVPKRVMSDRETQISLKEFKTFANQCCFNDITSGLRYPQSSGMMEPI